MGVNKTNLPTTCQQKRCSQPCRHTEAESNVYQEAYQEK
jgi:hypothetical protein